MQVITYFCDRCGMQSEDSSDFRKLDFDIKDGIGTQLLPRFDECCNKCINEVVDGVCELMKQKDVKPE